MFYSQNWKFVKAFDFGAHDNGICVGTDKLKNTYITGQSYYFTGGTGSTYKEMLCKYDSFGNSIWTTTLTTNYAHSVTDTLGNTYLAAGNKLYKYDNAGQKIWEVNCGSNLSIKKIAIHPWGGIVFVGIGVNSPVIGSVLQRYNESGTCLWSKFGEFSKSGSSGFAIACDKNGYIFVAGDGNKDVSTGNSGFLVKYDSNGNIQYNRFVPHTPKVLHVTNDEIFLGGWFSVYPISISGTTYTCDTKYSKWYLMKMDTSMNVKWHKILSNDANIGSVASDAQGNLFVGGSYADLHVDNYNFTSNTGEIFIMKVDSEGNIQWIKNSAGNGQTGSTTISDISVGSDNEITFTGTLYGFHDFDHTNVSVQSNMYGDLLIGRLSTTDELDENDVNIKKNEFDDGGLNAFPNPNNGKFIITYFSQKESSVQIRILDVHGKIIYTEPIQKIQGHLNKEVDFSNQAKGIYFIEMIADNERTTQKIVIE